MGRRDSEGKKPEWTIESGDWEKLYAAFLRAKEKNSLLDLRLERKLSALHGEKRHVDGILFNDIFEQKQLVFKYKCEVKSMKREALKRRELANRQTQSSRLPATKSLHQSKKIGPPKGGFTSRSDTFVTQLGNSENPTTVENNDRESAQQIKQKQTNNQFRFHMRGNVGRGESTPNDFKLPRVDSKTRRNSTQQSLIKMEDTEEAEKLDIVVAEYWVGDPIAIRSVRRPRLNPNEMSDHCQTYGQARKLMVNIPKYPSCSRNCNRPGAELESMVTDVSLLPKIRMPNLNKELKRLSVSQEQIPHSVPNSHASQTVLDLLEQHNKISQDMIIEAIDKEQHRELELVEGKFPESEVPSKRKISNEAIVIEDISDNDNRQTQEETTKLPRIFSKPNQSKSDQRVSVDTCSTSVWSGERSRVQSPVKSPSKLFLKSRNGSFGSNKSRHASLTVGEIIAANKNAPLNKAPIDVLARVKQGDIKVKSLTDTNRHINQLLKESEHRSITKRKDSIVVDTKSRFKTHSVKEAIRYSPTKVAFRSSETAFVN